MKVHIKSVVYLSDLSGALLTSKSRAVVEFEGYYALAKLANAFLYFTELLFLIKI